MMSRDSVQGCSSAVLRHIDELHRIFGSLENCVLAVSGGVDSMTLAIVAARYPGVAARMFHAVSPAVPQAATERVKRYAAKENWDLTITDAGEFEDGRYLENPVNRCFYCKSNLYETVAGVFAGEQIVSGTNADDIEDFRPGLIAARDHGVRHPYVEANIAKSEIREIARHIGSEDLSELPASPCLSSRVETGIRIESGTLIGIDRAENHIRGRLGSNAVVRCRIRQGQVQIELDEHIHRQLTQAMSAQLSWEIRPLLAEPHRGLPVAFCTYSMGSAFVGVKV